MNKATINLTQKNDSIVEKLFETDKIKSVPIKLLDNSVKFS